MRAYLSRGQIFSVLNPWEDLGAIRYQSWHEKQGQSGSKFLNDVGPTWSILPLAALPGSQRASQVSQLLRYVRTLQRHDGQHPGIAYPLVSASTKQAQLRAPFAWSNDPLGSQRNDRLSNRQQQQRQIALFLIRKGIVCGCYQDIFESMG